VPLLRKETSAAQLLAAQLTVYNAYRVCTLTLLSAMDYVQSVLYNEFTIDYLQWLQSRCSMDLIVCTNYSIDTIYFEDSLLNWLWTKPMEYVHWLYSHLLTIYSRYGTTSIWWTIYNDCNVAAQLTACTNCSIDTIYFDDSLLNWLRKIPVEYMTLLSSIDYVHSVWYNEYIRWTIYNVCRFDCVHELLNWTYTLKTRCSIDRVQSL